MCGGCYDKQQCDLLDDGPLGKDHLLRGCEGSEEWDKYLSISETKLEGEEKKRTTVRVFGETVDQFRQAIDEAAAAVVQQ